MSLISILHYVNVIAWESCILIWTRVAWPFCLLFLFIFRAAVLLQLGRLMLWDACKPVFAFFGITVNLQGVFYFKKLELSTPLVSPVLWHWGSSPLELAHVHQFGSFFYISFFGSGLLLAAYLHPFLTRWACAFHFGIGSCSVAFLVSYPHNLQ